MADITRLPNFQLKVIFIVHFVLISLSSIGFWPANAYLFYNFIFLLFLIWGLHQKENEEPLQLAFVINGLSIGLDVKLLAMGFPSSYQARERFSAAMAILNLIVRPFSTIYLGKIIQERTGSSGSGIDSIFPGGRNTSYEDIDRNVPSHPTQGGHDFLTAQQI